MSCFQARAKGSTRLSEATVSALHRDGSADLVFATSGKTELRVPRSAIRVTAGGTKSAASPRSSAAKQAKLCNALLLKVCQHARTGCSTTYVSVLPEIAVYNLISQYWRPIPQSNHELRWTISSI